MFGLFVNLELDSDGQLDQLDEDTEGHIAKI
jgi:hypothetical protein